MKKKIGLTLSGGGVRGVAHLGALKAMDEAGIRPDIISATSAGAIAAAFYAYGYGPEEILRIVRKEKFFSYRSLLFGKAGLFDMRYFDLFFRKYLPENDFSALKIPTMIVATDIVHGASVVFSEGNLSLALRATSCVPLIFQPVKHEEKILLDGGITNNFPVELIRDACTCLIGVHVNAINKDVQSVHMKDMIDRSFHLIISSSVAQKSGFCDLFIEPPDLIRFGMFDFPRIDEIFEIGYLWAKFKIEEAKNQGIL